MKLQTPKESSQMASGCESHKLREKVGRAPSGQELLETLGGIAFCRGLPIPAANSHRLVDSCSGSAKEFEDNWEENVVCSMAAGCVSSRLVEKGLAHPHRPHRLVEKGSFQEISI